MLTEHLEFVPERDQAIFAALPAAPAVFVLRGEEGSEPYVSKTADLCRRLMRLLSPPAEGSKRLNLRSRVRAVEYTPTGSDFESGLVLYKLLRQIFPGKYRERLKLRPAPLVRLNLDNPWPRAYVTRRLGKVTGKSVYYGPFPSRTAAERYLNDSLDFFKTRRCDFDLNPDPAFPGCIYSEMKMCLAPCFRGCSDEEYVREVERVEAYLGSGGRSLERELEQEREQASADLQFEQAAALHARLEKIRPVSHGLPEIVRPLERLRGVIVQPAAEAEAVALFRVEGGRIADAVSFPIAQQHGRGQSVESRLEAVLAEIPPLPPASAQEVMEHLALLRRWYYRKHKVGEIFLEDENGRLPLRRLVRGVSRVYRGERAEVDPIEAKAREYWLARTREQQDPGGQ